MDAVWAFAEAYEAHEEKIREDFYGTEIPNSGPNIDLAKNRRMTMKAPYDVSDLETGELLIEKGQEVSVDDFWALIKHLVPDNTDQARVRVE